MIDTEIGAIGHRVIAPPGRPVPNDGRAHEVSGGIKSLGGSFVVNWLTVSAGNTLDVTLSNYALTVKRDWTNNGAFTARSGTVTFR